MRELLKFVSGRGPSRHRHGGEGELVVLWVEGTILEGQEGPFHVFPAKLWLSWCVSSVLS